MSEEPQGPGWWQAIDGAWYPPEDRSVPDIAPGAGAPSMAEASTDMQAISSMSGLPTMQAAPVASPLVGLPVLSDTTPVSDVAGPKIPPARVPELPLRPTWSGDSDRNPEAGPMYPDLFSQAMSGSSLANVVTVNFADGEHRPGLDVEASDGRSFDAGGEEDLVSSSARMPAEVGAFSGASAKKRWHILR